ncbi:hypothetical protein EDD28_0005 [Salana multivorans]|uniref:Uncharacterized protein n=1 Tax=Salana multivorans TaxID=120377 RepID=A0A3N2D6R3_9MICO|nr:hypothetical protein [Salana multivorans]ROR95453.1 hypothetical protein EDD28_0005 [Salana multivorans]
MFVALKFGGVIAWPWWLVILFPLLAPVALALIWAALLVALALVVGAVREATIRRTAKKFSTRAGAR